MWEAAERERMRERLLAEREDLHALEASSSEARKPLALDPQSVGRLSRMSAIEQQAMLHAAQRRRETRVRMIAAALARIEAGEFGDCVRCGEPIGPRRLELHPPAAPGTPGPGRAAAPGR